MTIDEILALDVGDVNRLSGEDPAALRQMVSTLRSAAQKRVGRLEREGISTPPLKALQRAGGLRSVKGLDINQVKSEFAKYRQFLSAKQSTVQGAREFRQAVLDKVGVGGLTKEQDNLFWRTWDRLKDLHPELTTKVPGQRGGSSDVMGALRDAITSGESDLDTLLMSASQALTELYEQQVPEDDVDFFDLIDSEW